MKANLEVSAELQVFDVWKQIQATDTANLLLDIERGRTLSYKVEGGRRTGHTTGP